MPNQMCMLYQGETVPIINQNFLIFYLKEQI